MNPFSLEGRRALVTGANTGIGQAIAVSLGRAGRAGHLRRAARLRRDRGADRGGRRRSRDPAARLRRPDGGARCLCRRGLLDILVNNAGIIRREDSVDFGEADWDDVMDVNLKALFFTTQAFAKACFADGNAPAAVVNIASLLSFQGGIRVPSYTASKHGVAGLTKILANEWAAKGINVNAIAPGYIATNNTTALRADPVRNTAILERIPAGRWGDPSDIGGTAAFLCSGAARYIHGAVLNVDGGWLAR